jgi:hypothetical protein
MPSSRTAAELAKVKFEPRSKLGESALREDESLNDVEKLSDVESDVSADEGQVVEFDVGEMQSLEGSDCAADRLRCWQMRSNGQFTGTHSNFGRKVLMAG